MPPQRTGKTIDHKSKQLNAETFAGLAINSDGSEPIVRHNLQPVATSYESKRRVTREDLGKVWNDMQRHVLHLVNQAIENKVKLPFRMTEFVRLREAGKISVNMKGPIKELSGEATRLKAANGAVLVVDLDDVVVFAYFPKFIGKGLMAELLQAIGKLAKIYRPKSDQEIQDRRAHSRAMENGSDVETLPTRIMTRSQDAQHASNGFVSGAERGTFGLKHTGGEEENELADPSEGWSPSTLILEQGHTLSSSIDPCIDTTGKVPVRWENPARDGPRVHQGSPQESIPGPTALDDSAEYLSNLAPFAYYLSPGWYPTGMENTRPMSISAHFRQALESHCSAETIHLLETKRLYDRKLSYLTDIIHPSLGESMRKVRTCMSAITGPASIALENGWTSAFPCFAIAVNRTTQIHRDTKGIRGGVDIIGVLGTFTSGGELILPDLNLEVEWVPGCVGAFDGYDFRHKVNPWNGGTRVTLISFCRKSTWTGLKLDCTLVRPELLLVQRHLVSAQDVRAWAVQKKTDGQKEHQAIERKWREQKKANETAQKARQLAQNSSMRDAEKHYKCRADWDERLGTQRERGMNQGC